jgi:methionine biosynthesis protein MetW
MLRPDLAAIADMIEPNARVLDIGCGDGTLLEHLKQTRGVDGRGIELSQQNVNHCVARGLSVLQGDADTDLAEYPSQAFDVVILSQTIQATRAPAKVLDDLLRIGRHTIVSFPNFGHWRVRLSLLLNGRMPRTQALDYPWYETPNIHLCTIRDFTEMAKDAGAQIERALALNTSGTRPIHADAPGPNLFAEGAIFLMNRRGGAAWGPATGRTGSS